MPRRVTVWPVLPRVIVGTPAVAASAGPAAARAGAAAAAVLRKRRRLPSQEPCEPSIVATFQNEGSDHPGRTPVRTPERRFRLCVILIEPSVGGQQRFDNHGADRRDSR